MPVSRQSRPGSFTAITVRPVHTLMKIAAFTHQGQPHVGQVADDLQSVTPWDLPLAERELGYRCTVPVAEGIRRFCRWYLQERSAGRLP